ncbi:PD-(D/E)XK nuclease family protein [Neolewinella litorea]|uniref:PD-(D/E)XK endonuclease-like domain-containing protein n=1 Tax=Neolewinella litorea TaxID=2562452 RepID=A0A4S4NTZ8_9BACT|nr:PD-(D/E)XK nuclease family protein [Neolewinella litorea]THH41971.1 hypothetical protein E4021_05140 [Neolewinella litorea]
MIKIYLGLTFSSPLLPEPPATAAGELYLDYPGLVRYLEHFHALSRNPTNREALRTEQYRQLIEHHLSKATETPFYAASFAADPLATAEDLLERRDELLEAGYRLAAPLSTGTPARITVLHELEHLLLEAEQSFQLLPGLADRLNALLAALHDRRHPALDLRVHEPLDLLPPGLRRLLEALATAGDKVQFINSTPEPAPSGDLGAWQEKLGGLLSGREESGTRALRGDGSLIVIRAERETHIAAYLARMVRDNDNWRPGVLMTVRNQTLDTALLMEGLPSMGVPSTSLARPSLQVLKLVTAFLWEPVEVQRIMEFVSLVTKPLDRRLGQRLAEHLADTPGLFGARWNFAVEQSFREMEERKYPAARRRRAREQYEFWFRRRRYPRDGKAPKSEVRSLFVFLRNWALEAFDEDKEQSGLIVLSAQAERATELLDAQPETELSYLDVERLVRTIYQPAPTQFQPTEQGALPAAFAPASVAQLPDSGQDELERLIWWDFVETDPSYFFSNYYPPEIEFLRAGSPHGCCQVSSPEQRNQLQLWQNLRPALTPRRQLLLCIPRRVDGTEVEPHALMGDLEAAFSAEDLARITVDIDEAGQPSGLLSDLRLPGFQPVPVRPLDPPEAQVVISRPDALQPRERETPSSIDDLLFYPHKWVFRHQLGLRGTPILSIASENRLRGNLGHLFIEQLLEEVSQTDGRVTRAQVEAWVDDNADRLLRQQGAVLLEYGQEPDRVQFLLTMRKSAWTLVNYIQQSGWTVRGSEQELEGQLANLDGQVVRGRADLVLERTGTDGVPEAAVVDLKWRGKTTFRNLLRNGGDIQLALYAEFLRQQGSGRVHTAYYILRDALMLSRNELAFSGAETVPVDEDHAVIQRETVQKILATHEWRWEQLGQGVLEIRCKETIADLEDLYLDLEHDALLAMKDDTSPFDDYRSLIGLIR